MSKEVIKLDEANAEIKEVFVPIAAPKVEAGMIVRTIVFVLALINAVAAMFGYHWDLKIDQNLWYNIISAMIVVGSGLYSAWKNNNVTKAARIKQAVANQVVNKK